MALVPAVREVDAPGVLAGDRVALDALWDRCGPRPPSRKANLEGASVRWRATRSIVEAARGC